MIGGESLQRFIMWIPLERRTFDLPHPLHLDLEIQGYTIALGGGQPHAGRLLIGAAALSQGLCRGDRLRPCYLQWWLAAARVPARSTAYPPIGAIACLPAGGGAYGHKDRRWAAYAGVVRVAARTL
ncbi:hypothetical protein B296_00050546 [Ensete ventricosum]|uniref:Uncharacterized protein n=1 Tax=Ensete ventricosum TaxID=4639 RepID=A0A426YKM2_ENSVE|nr:hypothetical protein B296_00050546 [Ensete ventricosum]